MKTPFQRMVDAVKDKYELQEIFSQDGSHGFLHEGEKVTFYIGEPTGMEWYWTCEGKIAVENTEVFNKWSQVPFYVWLPETDEEVSRILEAIEYIGSEEAKELSDKYGCFNNKFGFEIPQRD